MARNRKRAKERRARRPQAVGAARGTRQQPPAQAPEEQAPEPIEHATPDVELAEAQLTVGRPALAAEPEVQTDRLDELELEEEEERELEAEAQESAPAGAVAARPQGVPEERPGTGTRLVHFLQGSWRELQRVQWPDRRQVMQATSVVIGFVIVAGVFLGVADFVAGKVMNFVLTGHFK